MDRGSNGDPLTLGSFFRSELYEMVDDPSTDSIVSWSESGKSFIVWDEKEFCRAFLPSEYLVKRLGFRKVEESEHWEYAYDYFERGQPDLKRPPHISDGPPLSPESLGNIEMVLASRKGLVEMDSSNHGLIPLSSLSCSRELYAIVNQNGGSSRQRRPSLFRRSFYDMVDDPSTDSIVSWSESGKSFIVWNESEFLRDVVPRYLSFLEYKEMTSFTRWLYVMGYRKVEESEEQWEFAGDYLVRGQPDQPEPISPPYTPAGGLMISPETGRMIERQFACWKKAQKRQASKSVV